MRFRCDFLQPAQTLDPESMMETLASVAVFANQANKTFRHRENILRSLGQANEERT